VFKVDVYNQDGKIVKQINISKDLVEGKISKGSLYYYVKMYLANQRQGNSSTKTRAEVRGSGAKPWKQKGTGRARSGTKKSPIWRGGGVAFGPKPRDYRIRMPKKMKSLALLSVLRSCFKNKKMFIIENLDFNQPKTKEMVKILNNLKLGENVLVGTEGVMENIIKSSNNIKKLKVKEVNRINAYDILVHENVLLTEKSIKILEQRLLGVKELESNEK
jgi:large subunit ribosomal protein L4